MVEPVSVVIIAKNESRHIEACLQSVQWADEIVVVDSGSSDDTCAIARRYTDKVFELPWQGFGPQKQAAVDLASHTMIFSIDCDERVPEELADELRGILRAGPAFAGYWVPRRTFIGAKEIRHSGWSPDLVVRLFDRNRARFSDHLVHESVVVDGPTSICSQSLLHFSFQSIGDMLPKLNQYSALAAQQMFESGKRCGWCSLIVKPVAAFMKTYVVKRGFLDGFEGLVIAVISSLSAFMKYARCFELKRTK